METILHRVQEKECLSKLTRSSVERALRLLMSATLIFGHSLTRALPHSLANSPSLTDLHIRTCSLAPFPQTEGVGVETILHRVQEREGLAKLTRSSLERTLRLLMSASVIYDAGPNVYKRTPDD